MTIVIREIAAVDAYPLRRSVLRTGTVTSEVAFDGDEDGVHFGAFDGDDLVGISSWLPIGEGTMFQLRGMATDPAHRGEGIGVALLDAGVKMAGERGVRVVVANARVTALEFYLAHGFYTVGDVYSDETTGLPHQAIARPIKRTA